MLYHNPIDGTFLSRSDRKFRIITCLRPAARSLGSKMRSLPKIILLIIVVSAFIGILAMAITSNRPSDHTANNKDTSDRSPANAASANLTASWPMFRGGPALLGVAPGKLPDSLKSYWKFKTEGAIRSSAAVENGRVYIGSDDGKIYCLNLSNGEEIWSFQTEDSVEATPCLLDGSVFAGSSDSFLYALDAKTGEFKWKYETGAKILGSVNWTLSPEKDKIWVLVGSYDNKLHCVDSVTGQLVWAYETDNYLNGAPAVADGKAVFGGCDALIHVVSVANGQQTTEIETAAYIAGSAALADGNAYTGNYGSEFLAANLSTSEILWTYDGDGSAFFSSPAVGKTQVIFGSRDENLYCLKRDNGELLWTFQTLGEVDSSPVICGNKVVVGSNDGRLYMVKLSDGKEVWSYEIGEAIISSPAIIGKMVIVGSEDGYVYAFGPENKRDTAKAGKPEGEK